MFDIALKFWFYQLKKLKKIMEIPMGTNMKEFKIGGLNINNFFLMTSALPLEINQII